MSSAVFAIRTNILNWNLLLNALLILGWTSQQFQLDSNGNANRSKAIATKNIHNNWMYWKGKKSSSKQCTIIGTDVTIKGK